MPFTVEATYEDGVRKLAQPLPLKEHERVQVTVQPLTSWVQETYGMLGWTGAPEDLRRLALAPEFDLEEEA
jgi:predicted DNA-binding antitoxin AbrB/MazE fold protein